MSCDVGPGGRKVYGRDLLMSLKMDPVCQAKSVYSAYILTALDLMFDNSHVPMSSYMGGGGGGFGLGKNDRKVL